MQFEIKLQHFKSYDWTIQATQSKKHLILITASYWNDIYSWLQRFLNLNLINTLVSVSVSPAILKRK